MMPTIFTGTNGITYQEIHPQLFGAWTQPLPITLPFHYPIGGSTYHVQPRPLGTPYDYPYLGPRVPLTVRNNQTINTVRTAVQKALAISGCLDSKRLFDSVNNSLVSMKQQKLDNLNIIKIIIKFVEEGWIIAKVNSTDVLDWEWCIYTHED